MARRTHFRLERLLELKAKHEEAMAIRLGVAESEARRERDAEAAMRAIRDAGRDDLLPAGASRVGTLRTVAELLDRVDDRLAQQAQRVVVAERTVHEAQRQLVVAHQERRVLDRLREKHAERVRLDAAHADQKTMDDIAVARFLRSRPLDP